MLLVIGIGAVIGIVIAYVLRDRSTVRSYVGWGLIAVVIVGAWVQHPGVGAADVAARILGNPGEAAFDAIAAVAGAAVLIATAAVAAFNRVAPD
jgi:hypothetical protein